MARHEGHRVLAAVCDDDARQRLPHSVLAKGQIRADAGELPAGNPDPGRAAMKRMRFNASDPERNSQFRRFRTRTDGRAFKKQPWRSRTTMRVWRAPDVEAQLQPKKRGQE